MSYEAIIAKIESQPGEYRKPLLAFFSSRAGQAGQLVSCAKPLGFTHKRAGGFADFGKNFTAIELPHQTDQWR